MREKREIEAEADQALGACCDFERFTHLSNEKLFLHKFKCFHHSEEPQQLHQLAHLEHSKQVIGCPRVNWCIWVNVVKWQNGNCIHNKPPKEVVPNNFLSLNNFLPLRIILIACKKG